MHHRVYVIQLGGDPKRVYVGSTGHTAQRRLKDHRQGIHSSRVVKACGGNLTLRPELAPDGVWTYERARKLEGITAAALRARGYTVYWG